MVIGFMVVIWFGAAALALDSPVLPVIPKHRAGLQLGSVVRPSNPTRNEKIFSKVGTAEPAVPTHDEFSTAGRPHLAAPFFRLLGLAAGDVNAGD